MQVSIIVAVGRNGVIGAEGEIPWRLPDDQKFFRKTTMGHALVMGRKTFDSIGKALPGRRNLVLTRRAHAPVEGVEFYGDLAAALDGARDAGESHCFVAGGEAIYREALDVADQLLVTRVDAAPAGDTFFPDIDPARFECTDRTPHEADERHAVPFVIETWLRRR